MHSPANEKRQLLKLLILHALSERPAQTTGEIFDRNEAQEIKMERNIGATSNLNQLITDGLVVRIPRDTQGTYQQLYTYTITEPGMRHLQQALEKDEIINMARRIADAHGEQFPDRYEAIVRKNWALGNAAESDIAADKLLPVHEGIAVYLQHLPEFKDTPPERIGAIAQQITVIMDQGANSFRQRAAQSKKPKGPYQAC